MEEFEPQMFLLETPGGTHHKFQTINKSFNKKEKRKKKKYIINLLLHFKSKIK